jgi:hypothetical protein
VQGAQNRNHLGGTVSAFRAQRRAHRLDLVQRATDVVDVRSRHREHHREAVGNVSGGGPVHDGSAPVTAADTDETLGLENAQGLT